MQVQWKSEQVLDKTAVRVLFVCFCFFCKDPTQTVWMHMYILIWNFVGHNYVFLHAVTHYENMPISRVNKIITQQFMIPRTIFTMIYYLFDENIWASSKNVPLEMFAQRRFRSACAFEQSELPWAHFGRTTLTLIRLHGYAG